MSGPDDPFSFVAEYGDPDFVRSARDPNRPPQPGKEWARNGRASDIPIEPGGEPSPFADLDDKSKPGKLEPDREALLQFVALMFKNADPRGYVSLRAFRDNDRRDEKPILIEAIQLNDPAFAAVLFERTRQAATWDDPAVFCPPVATFQNHQNAKTDNLFEGVDLSVECDQAPQAARSMLEALLGPTTVAVESGGEWTNDVTGEIEPKLHLHWRLKVPTRNKAEHELLKEARTLAANLVGADGTNKSIVHPIRWPGSWHRKRAPKLARIAACCDAAEINLAEALDVLREATGSTTFNSAGTTNNGKPLNFNVFGFSTTGNLRAPHDAAVAAALAVIPNDNELTDEKGNYVHGWNYWNEMGMKTWAATGGSEAGRAAFHEWSAKARKYDKAATDARWDHYKTSPPTKAGFGTLVWLARQHSPGWTYESAKDYTAEFAIEPIDPIDLWAKFDPPTLPRGVLPEVIEAFAFDRGMTMGCDMSGIAVGALAVCAAAIPDNIKLQPKKNDTEWQESARLWVAIVGSVSEMKTPIIDAATKPLRKIDTELAREYQDAKDEYFKLSKEDQKTPRPKQLRARIMNTTVEASQEILKDSPNGVLMDQDELSGFFGSMDKYSGPRGAQADRSFWLQAYNGGPYAVDRITRGNVFIPNLSISILGGIQPEPIRKLADGGEDDGLLQRFIPIVLRPAVVGGDEVPGQAVFDYNDLIRNLRELRPPNTGHVFPPTSGLKFDDGALAIRKELEKKHLDLSQCKSINRKLASHFGKYNGIFARLCVVFHCVGHVDDDELPIVVTEAIARRTAGFLHGFLLPHALAFHAGVLGLSNDHDRLANVADYILAHKLERITNRDIQRGDRTMRNLTRRETDVIFEQLDAFGWVTRTPGARPSDPPHWIVNPVVHQKFAERAEAAKKRRERGREAIDDLLKGAMA